MFLIYINDLPNGLKTVPRFFADDTALIFSSDNLQNLQLLVHSELFNVADWMLMNSLTINPTKTILLVLSPCSHKSFFDYNCSLNDVEIQVSHTAKYLGIFLDDRLSFKTHIDFLVSKISRSVGIMIKLRPYLPTETLTTSYYALVHSHIL